MRILVCGGRDFGNEDFSQRALLFRVLTRVHRRLGITEIIHGAARGADHLAGLWARGHGVTETRFPVDHLKDGPWPKAGPMRNIRMFNASKPDMVIAFPGGRGTGHMVLYARERDCPTYEVPR